MARFTTAGGSGDGTPGATGPQGPAGPAGEDAVLPQDLGTTDTPTFSTITLTSNGATNNITIGDDVILGDGNVANHLVIIGQQDATAGGIVLGTNETEFISTNGTDLSVNANNDIILNPGSTYAYLGTPEIDGSNRIATIGDINDTVSTGMVRYSPTFAATGLAFTGSDTTYPTYNSYYVKSGKMVSFVIEVDCSTVTNFGTGQFKLQLPFTPAFGFNHFTGWAWADPDVSPDTGTGHTIINADTAGITDILDLHYLKSAGGANAAIREGLLIQGTPVTLTTSSKIYVNGTYISQ